MFDGRGGEDPMTDGDGHRLSDPSKEELQDEAREVWKRLKVAGLRTLIVGAAVVVLFGAVAYRALGGLGIGITVVAVGVAVVLLVRHLEYY